MVSHSYDVPWSVQPYKNGIRLIEPSDRPQHYTIRLGRLLESPYQVYFNDSDLKLHFANKSNAKAIGFEHVEESLYIPLRPFLPKTTYSQLIENNEIILKNERPLIIRETFFTEEDHQLWTCLSVKFPWYDYFSRLAGIFGISIILNPQNYDSLVDSLNMLSTLGLVAKPELANEMTANTIKKFNLDGLTYRENTILEYVVQGKTAKEISAILYISHRTVEKHIFNIKSKLKLTTRSQLISFILDNQRN